ncbi:hypothetical protein IQ07DRAFT_669617 [Pyrenochaeta sp. DS3sAY3a]|nr:hypothetical protein IQ07DRAFT_669617 [Pyrenochaeta sp. DS3sAY3a]
MTFPKPTDMFPYKPSDLPPFGRRLAPPTHTAARNAMEDAEEYGTNDREGNGSDGIWSFHDMSDNIKFGRVLGALTVGRLEDCVEDRTELPPPSPKQEELRRAHAASRQCLMVENAYEDYEPSKTNREEHASAAISFASTGMMRNLAQNEFANKLPPNTGNSDTQQSTSVSSNSRSKGKEFASMLDPATAGAPPTLPTQALGSEESSMKGIKSEKKGPERVERHPPGLKHADALFWYVERGLPVPNSLEKPSSRQKKKAKLVRTYTDKFPWRAFVTEVRIWEGTKYPELRDKNGIVVNDKRGNPMRRSPRMDRSFFRCMEADEEQHPCHWVYATQKSCPYPDNNKCFANHNFSKNMFIWLVKERGLDVTLANHYISNALIKKPKDMVVEMSLITPADLKRPSPSGTMSQSELDEWYDSHTIVAPKHQRKKAAPPGDREDTERQINKDVLIKRAHPARERNTQDGKHEHHSQEVSYQMGLPRIAFDPDSPGLQASRHAESRRASIHTIYSNAAVDNERSVLSETSELDQPDRTTQSQARTYDLNDPGQLKEYMLRKFCGVSLEN